MSWNLAESCKKIIIKYRTELVYLVIGGLTTIINYAIYFIGIEWLGFDYLFANVIAWFAAVLFAYISNRRWVFKSKNRRYLKEFLLFIVSRLFSLLLETGFMLVSVEWMNINELIAKIFAAILVVLSNYAVGKYLVFKPFGGDNNEAN